MQKWGNAKANSYWERKLPPNFNRPNDQSSMEELEKYIRAKYERKQWVDPKFNPEDSIAPPPAEHAKVVNTRDGIKMNDTPAQPEAQEEEDLPPNNMTISQRILWDRKHRKDKSTAREKFRKEPPAPVKPTPPAPVKPTHPVAVRRPAPPSVTQTPASDSENDTDTETESVADEIESIPPTPEDESGGDVDLMNFDFTDQPAEEEKPKADVNDLMDMISDIPGSRPLQSPSELQQGLESLIDNMNPVLIPGYPGINMSNTGGGMSMPMPSKPKTEAMQQSNAYDNLNMYCLPGMVKQTNKKGGRRRQSSVEAERLMYQGYGGGMNMNQGYNQGMNMNQGYNQGMNMNQGYNQGMNMNQGYNGGGGGMSMNNGGGGNGGGSYDPLDNFVMMGAPHLTAPGMKSSSTNHTMPSNVKPARVPSQFDSLDPFANSSGGRGRRNSMLDGIEDVVAPPKYH